MANSTVAIVRRKIEKIEEGALFAYSNFNFDKSGELSVAKALSRMAKEGTIVPKANTINQGIQSSENCAQMNRLL
jgi:hypothetical protein